MIRRLVPLSVLPLALIACALAASPWLRAFPSDVIAVPLFGAAVLSVIAPAIVVGIGLRRLWLTAIVDVALFVLYELFVTLRDPSGYGQLWTGLVHGPAQILSFALPLVSPRDLLVAPVALCWLTGAILGECVARSWNSVVPYLVLLVAFAMSYAATTRAITSSADGRRYDTLLAGGLLLALLLLRVAQTWVGLERGATATQLDGRLPLRGLMIGAAASLVVAVAAAGAVQSTAFDGRPRTPARTPPLNRSEPLTPISFVSGLRPADPRSQGRTLFDVDFSRPSTGYVTLASVDSYDGEGWTFQQRTFRPSGGVVPAEDDPALRPTTRPISQSYTIDAGPLTTVPWMPYLHRVTKVSGVAVNVDAGSGMVVPAHRLTAGTSYTVESSSSGTLFGDLPATAVPSRSGPASDVQLPGAVGDQLTPLISAYESEFSYNPAQPIAFLQRIVAQFQGYALSGGPRTATPSASSSSATGSTRSASRTSSKPAPSSASPTPGGSSASPTGTTATGGTGFADVLASIRQNHSATPEQYATLTALIARYLNVRARVVAGFRIPTPSSSPTLPAGRYAVHAAEAWTWVEIPIEGVGWVVLNPSPGNYSGKDTRSSAAPTGSSSPTPTQSVAFPSTASNGNGRGVAKPGTFPGSHDLSTLALVLIVVGAVVVVLLGLLVLLLLRKRLRARHRRGADDPRRRVVGAWREALDVLVESGLPELDHLTCAEVSELTEAEFGTGPAGYARAIGDSANVAIFGPPAWTGDEQADAAWSAHTQLRREVRRALGRRERVRAALRYHRRSRSDLLVGPPSWLAARQAIEDGSDRRSGWSRDQDGGRGGGARLRRAPARRAR